MESGPSGPIKPSTSCTRGTHNTADRSRRKSALRGLVEMGVEPFPVALFPDPGLLHVGHFEALLDGAVVGHDAHGAPAGFDLDSS